MAQVNGMMLGRRTIVVMPATKPRKTPPFPDRPPRLQVRRLRYAYADVNPFSLQQPEEWFVLSRTCSSTNTYAMPRRALAPLAREVPRTRWLMLRLFTEPFLEFLHGLRKRLQNVASLIARNEQRGREALFVVRPRGHTIDAQHSVLQRNRLEGVDKHLGHLRVSLSCWDSRLISRRRGDCPPPPACSLSGASGSPPEAPSRHLQSLKKMLEWCVRYSVNKLPTPPVMLVKVTKLWAASIVMNCVLE
jgi:hypothetical protein